MKFNDLQMVLDVLCVRADELKSRVESHENYSRKLDHLISVVRSSSLDADVITDLIFVLKEKDCELWSEIFEMNVKISALDAFHGEITQSINDNDENCVYFELESDN